MDELFLLGLGFCTWFEKLEVRTSIGNLALKYTLRVRLDLTAIQLNEVLIMFYISLVRF